MKQANPALPRPKKVSHDAKDILAGLRGVHVIAKLNDDSLKNRALVAAELVLRRSGIRIFTIDEVWDVLGSPILYVRLSISNKNSAFIITFDLNQSVRLENNPLLLIDQCTVWTQGMFGQDGTNEDKLKVVTELAEMFANDYLKANPKK